MTASTIIHLFPDTNLFVQCQRLDQLDWSAWKAFDEVRLIVARPVQREIDNRKNKGNDRVGKHARATSAMFRKIITAGQGCILVRDSNPCVKLFVEPHHNPSKSKEVVDRLNYDERDDQLVGTVFEYAAQNLGETVRLLTHDTTPMFTARSLGIEVDVIPDSWLLPPENTKAEKQIAALLAENARLKRAEPSFEIRCQDGEGAEIERYETSYTWFDPLTDDEVDSLVQCLKETFPPATDFGSREAAVRDATPARLQFLATKEEFTPATDEEIAAYRDEAYPTWLQRCEEILREYHRTLQRETHILSFAFLVRNTGTRPAKDALVTLEAEGRFTIMPPAPNDNDDEEEYDEIPRSVTLPYPPAPPRGKWQKRLVGGLGDNRRQLAGLQRSLARAAGLRADQPNVFDGRLLSSVLHPTPHDPNAFYYKPRRPRIPQSAFQLECDQWRHGDEDEVFAVEISVPTEGDSVEGVLTCRIQAENLSEIALKMIPVRIAISRVSALEQARALVDVLVYRPRLGIGFASGQRK